MLPKNPQLQLGDTGLHNHQENEHCESLTQHLEQIKRQLMFPGLRML